MIRSRAKEQLEDTLEGKEEEMESMSKKGRNLKKILREMEYAREKEAGNQSSLYHLVRTYVLEKQAGEAVEGKKERVPSQPNKK